MMRLRTFVDEHHVGNKSGVVVDDGVKLAGVNSLSHVGLARLVVAS